MKIKSYVVVAFLCVSVACSRQAVPVGTLVEPLSDTLWSSSSWISAPDAPVADEWIRGGERAADGSNWFLTTVENSAEVVSAKWMTTGLGVYELYVNGQIVGEEILKPGFTDYLKTKRSFTYDVTDAFNTREGEHNTLSSQVTPGWWADLIITPFGNKGMMGRKCAFRSVLELTYADGSRQYFGTDTTSWRAGIAGPVTHAAIYDGEEYDARIPMGYDTPERLGTPELNQEFTGEILPSCGAEIYFREDLTLSPIEAYVWKGTSNATEDEYGQVVILRQYKPGEEMIVHKGENLVVDFGQNCSAVPDFVFSASEGTTLTCLPSEILNDGNGAQSRGMDGPEGSCHRRNLRTADTGMRVKYTFAGSDKYEHFRPRVSFFGYRYVWITATGDIKIKSISSVPVSSITQTMETGEIETGNQSINQLISNTLWGQRSNYLSVTTDCPQRDERLGWTADTQVFAETGTYFASTDRFFHKWMRDLRDTQSPVGGFPGVAPRGRYGSYDMMRLGWSDAGVIVPWVVWKQFGDESIIDENWDAMDAFITHIEQTKYNHMALIAENNHYQWADWLSYEPLESCGGGIADGDGERYPETYEYWNYLGASYWAIDEGMMRDMALASGRDASRYEDMYSQARDYLKSNFLNEDGSFKTDILNTMQTPALFALKNNLVEGQARASMIERLRRNFEAHGNCLQTGFLGTSILMSTLTGNGMIDIAYELLFQRNNPSWLYSIDNGATTIWERWNSYMLDKGMGPQGMNSFNHYAYGCVCEWIWESVAGISADVVNPGFKHIIMSPLPDRRLGYVRAQYKSAAGLIKSEWKYEGDQWHWDFTIPEGSTASVTLPNSDTATEYSSGSYSITIDL